MKIRLILARTGWDPQNVWTETRTAVADVPYQVGFGEKEYKVIGAEPLGESDDLAVNLKTEHIENPWVPVSERLPDFNTRVLVVLTHTYEDDYREYGIAKYMKFSDGECHWREDRHGYLEWDKYSDGHGGNSSYKVIAWMSLPPLPEKKMQ